MITAASPGRSDRPTRQQSNVVLAAYLGWTLDAFDFFIMAFVLRDVAAALRRAPSADAWRLPSH